MGNSHARSVELVVIERNWSLTHTDQVSKTVCEPDCCNFDTNSRGHTAISTDTWARVNCRSSSDHPLPIESYTSGKLESPVAPTQEGFPGTDAGLSHRIVEPVYRSQGRLIMSAHTNSVVPMFVRYRHRHGNL